MASIAIAAGLASASWIYANPATAERVVGTRDVSPAQSLVTFNVSDEHLRNEWMRLGVEHGAFELSRIRVHLTEGRFRDIQAPTLVLNRNVGLPIPLAAGQRPLRIEVYGRPLRQGTRLILSEGRQPPDAAPYDSQSASVRRASQSSETPSQQVQPDNQYVWTAFAGHQTRLDDRDITLNFADTGLQPSAIRLRSVGAPLHVYLLRVDYSAGQFRKLAMRAFVPQNGTSNALPLPIEAGPIKSVRISFSVPQGVAAAPRIELEALGSIRGSARVRPTSDAVRPPPSQSPGGSVRVTDGNATFQVVADTF